MRESLPKSLTQKPFTFRQAVTAGLGRYELRMLLRNGTIERLERGIYRQTKDDFAEPDRFCSALLSTGEPSATCLLSALSWYGLTDIIPKKTWVMVDAKKRTSNRSVRLVRMQNPQWKIGIEEAPSYRITSIERTIIDSFRYAKLVGKNTAVQALRSAIQLKKTNPKKIWEIALKLNASKIMTPYMEMMI